MSPSRALTLLLLLTAAAATEGPGVPEVAGEASGDGQDLVVAEMAPLLPSEDSAHAAELADEGLMSAESSDEAAAAEAHRQDLATRRKQAKRTDGAVRPEQELRPQLRPSSASPGGGGFIASKSHTLHQIRDITHAMFDSHKSILMVPCVEFYIQGIRPGRKTLTIAVPISRNTGQD